MKDKPAVRAAFEDFEREVFEDFERGASENFRRERRAGGRRFRRQMTMTADFSDILAMRYETRTRLVDSEADIHRVPVEVVFRLGWTTQTHLLPFTYPLRYFLS